MSLPRPRVVVILPRRPERGRPRPRRPCVRYRVRHTDVLGGPFWVVPLTPTVGTHFPSSLPLNKRRQGTTRERRATESNKYFSHVVFLLGSTYLPRFYTTFNPPPLTSGHERDTIRRYSLLSYKFSDFSGTLRTCCSGRTERPRGLLQKLLL